MHTYMYMYMYLYITNACTFKLRLDTLQYIVVSSSGAFCTAQQQIVDFRSVCWTLAQIYMYMYVNLNIKDLWAD